jgi:CRP-like cAMP-binding protein
MGAIWDFVRRLLRRPLSTREFVARLFPGVDHALLTGLVARVARLKLTEVGAVVDLNLNQQAAMGIERGALESVKLTNGEWEAFWRSTPGTVFNTDGLRRKLQGPCMCRVAKQVTLMLLSADDFEAELKVNQPLAEALGSLGE